MDKISAVWLRGVERLFHLDGESGITQNELANLQNRKIAANMEEKEKSRKSKKKRKGGE